MSKEVEVTTEQLTKAMDAEYRKLVKQVEDAVNQPADGGITKGARGVLKNPVIHFGWCGQSRLCLALKSRRSCIALSGLFMGDGFYQGFVSLRPGLESVAPSGLLQQSPKSLFGNNIGKKYFDNRGGNIYNDWAVLSSAKLRFDMFLEKKSRWAFFLSWR